jgi:hypothetical protein
MWQCLLFNSVWASRGQADAVKEPQCFKLAVCMLAVGHGKHQSKITRTPEHRDSPSKLSCTFTNGGRVVSPPAAAGPSAAVTATTAVLHVNKASSTRQLRLRPAITLRFFAAICVLYHCFECFLARSTAVA